eukprot:snap_masked-scaffold_5-processed-gene-9.10-mRNA-1 protein AED:1.00 eAED:1.00 QI:0/0/0/0/1/1/2/0/764
MQRKMEGQWKVLDMAQDVTIDSFSLTINDAHYPIEITKNHVENISTYKIEDNLAFFTKREEETSKISVGETLLLQSKHFPSVSSIVQCKWFPKAYTRMNIFVVLFSDGYAQLFDASQISSGFFYSDALLKLNFGIRKEVKNSIELTGLFTGLEIKDLGIICSDSLGKLFGASPVLPFSKLNINGKQLCESQLLESNLSEEEAVVQNYYLKGINCLPLIQILSKNDNPPILETTDENEFDQIPTCVSINLLNQRQVLTRMWSNGVLDVLLVDDIGLRFSGAGSSYNQFARINNTPVKKKKINFGWNLKKAAFRYTQDRELTEEKKGHAEMKPVVSKPLRFLTINETKNKFNFKLGGSRQAREEFENVASYWPLVSRKAVIEEAERISVAPSFGGENNSLVLLGKKSREFCVIRSVFNEFDDQLSENEIAELLLDVFQHERLPVDWPSQLVFDEGKKKIIAVSSDFSLQQKFVSLVKPVSGDNQEILRQIDYSQIAEKEGELEDFASKDESKWVDTLFDSLDNLFSTPKLVGRVVLGGLNDEIFSEVFGKAVGGTKASIVHDSDLVNEVILQKDALKYILSLIDKSLFEGSKGFLIALLKNYDALLQRLRSQEQQLDIQRNKVSNLEQETKHLVTLNLEVRKKLSLAKEVINLSEENVIFLSEGLESLELSETSKEERFSNMILKKNKQLQDLKNQIAVLKTQTKEQMLQLNRSEVDGSVAVSGLVVDNSNSGLIEQMQSCDENSAVSIFSLRKRITSLRQRLLFL